MSEVLFTVGTVPFALAGGAHLAMTLYDLRHPTFFKPTDESLIGALDATGFAVSARAPLARSAWRTWVGLNLSHALGLIVFAVLLFAVAVHDYTLVSEIPIVQPLSIVTALAYVVFSLRFWFLTPAILSSIGLGCFVAAALL